MVVISLLHTPSYPRQQCTQIPVLVAPVQTTRPSTPPPNSSTSSPHRITHPRKLLFYTVHNLVQTISRGVVPQSTGPPLHPPKRRLCPPTRHQQPVSLISPSISRMAAGRGFMVSQSTTQSNFCPCEVGTPHSFVLRVIPMHSQRALNALLLLTVGLSLTKRSSISAESKRSKCCDSTDAEMQLRWKMSKQKEWYGFYSEVSPLHSEPNPRPTTSFGSLLYTNQNNTSGPFKVTLFPTSSVSMSCPKL